MIFQKCAELKSKSIPFVLVTMTEVKGSAPQNLGAKCIVTIKGLDYGTVGGGKVEAAAIDKAITMIKSEEQSLQTITWNLQRDIGMTCGGEATFIFEPFLSNNWPIAIFGAGHVAQALTKLLGTMNCQVTCIDNRKEWIDKVDTKIKTLLVDNIAATVKELNPNSFFISMTQGHASDVPVLIEIYKHFPDCRYVGVIGSAAKGNRIKKELLEAGVSQSFIDKLLIPIGLPIGNNDPSEIAVSIAAQLLELRN